MARSTKRQAIADEVRRRINSGAYAAGSELPAQRELMSEFSAARETVRGALGQLAAEGLITQGQGAEARVRDDNTICLSAETDAVTWADRVGDNATDEVVDARREAASGVVADRLGVPDDTPVLRLVRHQGRDSTLVAVVTQWLPAELADAITAATGHDLANHVGDLWEYMTRAGITPTSSTETICTRISSEDEQRLFGIAPGIPVLVSVRVTVSAAGQPVEYSVADQRGDMAVMVYVNPISR